MHPRSSRNRSVDRVRRPAARRLALGLLLAVGLTPPAARAEDSPPLPNTSRSWLLADAEQQWFGPQMLVSCDHRRVGPDRTSVAFCAQSLPKDASHRLFYFSSHPFFNDSVRSAVRPRETSKIEIPTEPGEYVHTRAVQTGAEFGGRVLFAVPIVKGLPPEKRFTSLRVNYYLYDVAKATLTLAHQGPSRATKSAYLTLEIHGPGDELGMWVTTDTRRSTSDQLVTWPVLHWVGDRLEADARPPAPKAKSVHVSPQEDQLLKQIAQAYARRSAAGPSVFAPVIRTLRASLEGRSVPRRLAYLQEVLDALRPGAPSAEPWRAEPPTCKTAHEQKVCTTRETSGETARYLVELSGTSAGAAPPARYLLYVGKDELLLPDSLSIWDVKEPFGLLPLELTTGKPTRIDARRRVFLVAEKTASGYQLYPGWSSPPCLGDCTLWLQTLGGAKGADTVVLQREEGGERPTSFFITSTRGDWRRVLAVEATGR